jgi:uncharacterized phage protein (TIGR01671 family)
MILFRAKNAEKDEWAEGYFAWFTINTGEQVPVIIAPYHFGEKEIHYTNVDASTVRQYIGTYDCKGERIFEGDIIKINERNIYVVEYYEENAKFELCTLGGAYMGFDTIKRLEYVCEIIGNKYDNPELLDNYDKKRRNIQRSKKI